MAHFDFLLICCLCQFGFCVFTNLANLTTHFLLICYSFAASFSLALDNQQSGKSGSFLKYNINIQIWKITCIQKKRLFKISREAANKYSRMSKWATKFQLLAFCPLHYFSILIFLLCNDPKWSRSSHNFQFMIILRGFFLQPQWYSWSVCFYRNLVTGVAWAHE